MLVVVQNYGAGWINSHQYPLQTLVIDILRIRLPWQLVDWLLGDIHVSLDVRLAQRNQIEHCNPKPSHRTCRFELHTALRIRFRHPPARGPRRWTVAMTGQFTFSYGLLQARCCPAGAMASLQLDDS